MSVAEQPGRRPVVLSPSSRRAAVVVALCGLLALATAAAVRTRAGRGVSSRPDKATAGSVRPAAARPEPPSLFTGTVTRDGIAVEFSLRHDDPAKFQATEVLEGDDIRIRFKITDTAGARPVRSLNPAAWMDLIPPSENLGVRTCEQKVRAFLGGSIFGRAELDLNVFNVLTLNNEPGISIVDPLFGFGGTKLLGMVVLESPGEDWAMNNSETRVYVSVPGSRQVVAVETGGWAISQKAALGHRPGRVALSPDDASLWVADGEDVNGPGVTVLDTAALKPAGRVVTGRGPHELAFSDDGRWGFVTNGRDGTVTVVDARSLKAVASLPAGPEPVSVAFSPLARMAYVAGRDGTVTVVDGDRRRVVTRIKADAGLGQIRFAPGGRLGFVVNPAKDVVHIIDAARNRVVQTADVEDEPDQVAFSDEFAYVRHRGSATVLMLPLKVVGVEGRPVQAFSFPGGETPPGKAPELSPAAAIVQAPGENAVLVANPMDRSVYYYKEGMAAPMGNFSNYGRQPRALLVVDRTLKERGTPGVYETVARVRKPGDYEVVFLNPSPRIVHCFPATVLPSPELEGKRLAGRLGVEHLVEQRRVPVDEDVRLRFRLTDLRTKAPVPGLDDVEVLTNLMPGVWHMRHTATPEGDGVYALDFKPPRPGLYYIHVQCLSRGLSFNNDRYLVIEAVDEG